MPLSTINVLLIEDDPDFAELLALQLSTVRVPKIKFEWAEDLAAVNTKLAQFPADVLLVDLGLPGETGLSALLKLQARYPLIPKVVLTGLSDDDLSVKALKLGAQDYLSKSRADNENIVRAVRHAIVRQQQAVALKTMQERFENAVLASNDGFFDWKMDDDHVFRSRRFIELLGYQPHEHEPTVEWWESKVHPDDLPRVWESVHAHCSERTPFEVKFRMLTKQGEYRWFFSRGEAQYGVDGNAIRISGAVTDITDSERAVEKRERILLLEQREEFIATLTHDLKNPLIGVDRLLECFLDGSVGDLSDEQTILIQQIRSSNQSVVALIQNMLELYRQDKYPDLFVPCCFEIEQLFANAGRDWSLPARLQGVELRFENFDRDCCAYADVQALGRVLSNLILNALKFTPSGGIITVSAYAELDTTRIEVSDTGLGMTNDEVSRIFEQFWQGKQGRRMSCGSGLGVFVCKQIVESNGGTISCTSERGAGTTFTIQLPRERIGELATVEIA